MKTYSQNTNRMKITRRLAASCLLLFALAGNALAQGTDGQFVIKKGDHYLAHVYNGSAWVLQDVNSFSPNCLWYSGPNFNPSGTNHNYYFYDGENYRFLSAPFEPDGTLSLSASLPATSLLRNTDQIYYFYDWDSDTYGGGLARGHQYSVSTEEECTTCGGNWHDVNGQGNYQCWEVYWLEYDSQWKLTSQSHYSRNPEEDDGNGGVPNAGLFRGVTITEHPIQVTSTDPDHPGLTSLTIPQTEMNQNTYQQLSAVISGEGFSYNYIPAYTEYGFEGSTHYYYEEADHGEAPTNQAGTSNSGNATYEWTISGEGAYYLTFDDGSEHVYTSNSENPTVYYSFANTEGRKMVTITLTVTYGNTGATQTLSAEIQLNVECQSPNTDVSVTYEDVTISWYPTAEQYKVYLTTDPADWSHFVEVDDVTSYTFTGLAYGTLYYYKVAAICGDEEKPATQRDFTTLEEPGLLVYGAIFGGGRMADVGGKTEVVIINCEEIDAIFGGNDIAGTVSGADGSNIILGVNSGDTYASYGITGTEIKIGDVYGGGNGYYAYNGSSFEPASYNSTYDIANGASINAMTPMHTVGDVVWTNSTGSPVHLVCPTISKTNITVSNDYIVIDSLFGGAKNAILNNTSKDVDITINGGTIYTVFGGNNFGGSLGYWSNEYITVNNTKTTATVSDYNDGELGRDFGIGYVFGGGNKVMGQQVHITIEGGQCDTIFGGGNAADVRSTEVTVNCALGAAAGGAFGKVYFGGISSASPLTIDENYGWAGTGIYNIRTLFGGNNKATMAGLPTLTLTSGGIGTVYGGGNAGDMLANQSGTITYASEDINFDYSTHVVMNSPTILIDNLYGGCQMSNVDYSTWVELKNGHVGTVYGGCNVSGDVGSTRVYHDFPYSGELSDEDKIKYQTVQGATYVVATGGTVYGNLFAGSNGFYHCNNGTVYVPGINYGDEAGRYIGMDIPTHNETQVIVSKDDEAGTAVTVKGNVYAGGNMAPVGFTIAYVGARPSFPALVGLSSVRMNGGTVEGDVYGGGNMASIYGSNEVIVSGGTILGALYGGNDRTGSVADMSNRVLPSIYDYASDGKTPLELVDTYISLTGTPNINTVFGGGNGYYAYFSNFDEADDYDGDLEPVVACFEDDEPIQSRTFIDINIAHDGHINTVYGGGDGVTVTGFIKVFLNVDNPDYTDEGNHVGVIFGGNNKGDLVDLVPDIILLHGKVGTVYGGCNEGALGHRQNFNIGGTTYNDVGSMVYLRSAYDGDGEGGSDPITPTAKVTEAVYGGCRMNGVTYNTLVLVESGEHPATFFGGSDVSGDIGGLSQVVVTGGSVGTVYGGGNGDYTYTGEDHAPYCGSSSISLTGGTITGNVFGGGKGQGTKILGNVDIDFGKIIMSEGEEVHSEYPKLIGELYGGSALGEVNTNSENTTTVNILNGTVNGNVYGGGLGQKNGINGATSDIAAIVNGKVHVNVGRTDGAATPTFTGKASFVNSSIFGCNNLNGSPQADVYVDVYQTNHTATDMADYFVHDDRTYAIKEVFGGGNRADFTVTDKLTHVYVHGCENTIQYVYGGGNAADVYGVWLFVEGGRFDESYGGGNGLTTAANVGAGGIQHGWIGGRYNFTVVGSNKTGNIDGTLHEITTEEYPTTGCITTCVGPIIDSWFNGANEAEIYGGLNCEINCGWNEGYKTNVYAGSRWAIVYGDITLTVRGGYIGNLFGGSMGYSEFSADVRKYPAADYDWESNPNGYSDALKQYMIDNGGLTGSLAGTGGNININIYGGTIGNLYGGCDVNGNVEGKITIYIEDQGGDCPLFIGNIYGASNETRYEPTDGNAISPEVTVAKGTVGGDTNYGDYFEENVHYDGNVFGGSNRGNVTANPKVHVGPTATYPVTVKGNVYGGGNEGDVDGSPQVIIGPAE